MTKSTIFIISIIYITAGLILILATIETFGIQCWVCNSYSDKKCADPFDNRSYAITDCDSKEQTRDNLPGVRATMCRKISQKVNGIWRYIRSCAFVGEPGIGRDERYCRRRKGTHDIYVEDCLCRSKTGCNHSSSIYTNSIRMLPVLFIVTYIYQRFLL